MIFYVIFGDFVGWDWGTPAILQQKHPWTNWIKIWDWQIPPPQLGQKPKFFRKSNLKAPLKGPQTGKGSLWDRVLQKGPIWGTTNAILKKLLSRCKGSFFSLKLSGDKF